MASMTIFISLLALSAITVQSTIQHDTPVTRVVNLLKTMQKTLQADMDEDEALYDKLSCWCKNNRYEKNAAIEEATAKISELESSIESLTAKSAELKDLVAETTKKIAEEKAALKEATAIRQKEAADFHARELDSTQALENLKAAIEVLSKHHGAALPQLSFLQVQKGMPWAREHESSDQVSFDNFMSSNNFADSTEADAPAKNLRQSVLQQSTAATSSSQWSEQDLAVVRQALHSATAFSQQHHTEQYYPSYNAQSGEIMGVLKQLKEEMAGDLSDDQKAEADKVAAFNEMRAAKTLIIENSEKLEEKKEDELATTNVDLAEAKEDLEQTNAALSEDQKFMITMNKQCAEGDAGFEQRRKARLEEIKAVSETIEILTADEARDAMNGTYNFLQLRARRHTVRQRAAKLLRDAGAKMNNPTLSVLATSVELDAFSRVKKAIDDMLTMMAKQQEDEVKKNDWCKQKLQANEMKTMETNDVKGDQEAKIESLNEKAKQLSERLAAARAEIAEMQTNLQRASEDRKSENMEYQKTWTDQTMTIEVLNKAMERMAQYYDAALVQARRSKQTPPVAQMTYKPSAGSGGVMSMIEKLIYDAKELRKDAKSSEQSAQGAYEGTVADTFAGIGALQKEVATKLKEKAATEKESAQTQSDLKDTMTELEDLDKTNADLHADCDYLLKNFDIRQESRAQEMEALRQAKQILNGANLGN